jgi:hypothetical protein
MGYKRRSIDTRIFRAHYSPSRRIVAQIGLAIYLFVLSVSCSAPTPPQPVSVDTLSLRDLYPGALRIAKAWKEDAYLVETQASFWPVDSNGFRRAFFSFRSSSTNVIGLFVSYDPATGLFEDEWLSVAHEDPQQKEEIADTDWRLDSIEALEVAQRAGGAEFLARQLDKDLHLYLRLEKRQIGTDLRTVWLVAYYAGMPPTTDTSIVIDAATGQVLEARNAEG